MSLAFRFDPRRALLLAMVGLAGLPAARAEEGARLAQAPDDRHAQTTADFLLARGAMEALAQAGKLIGRQRFAVVLDLQVILRDAQRDQTALRRIAHRVVEQVAQQHGQQLIIPPHRHRLGALRRPVAGQFDVATLGQCQAIADGLFDDGLPLNRSRHGQLAGRLER